MSKFSLISIDAIKGKIKFFKLVKDGKCEFDEFETEARKNFSNELFKIFAYMDRVSNLMSMSSDKFRDITQKREKVKEYEFKTRHLRVYVIKEEQSGNIIICGGYKNTQERDIKHFRELKKEYLKSKV